MSSGQTQRRGGQHDEPPHHSTGPQEKAGNEQQVDRPNGASGPLNPLRYLLPLRLGAEIAFDLSLAVALAAGDAMLRLTNPAPAAPRETPPLATPGSRLNRWRPPKTPPPLQQMTVSADDGVQLHVEIDGDPRAPVTVVLCHGYALSLESWGLQREALAKRARLVLWDHRGHGQSGPVSGEQVSIARIGQDLHTVLRAAVPSGPVVLVGHSMGGMAILALARQHPELFGDRVRGVGLLATSADPISGTLGFPRYVAEAVRLAVPGLLSALRREGPLSLWTAQDLARLLTRRYAFVSEVPPALVDYLADMIRATPIETLACFFPHFRTHDESEALPVLRGVETLLIAGDGDLLTPVEDSERIAAAVPDAEFVVAADAGHAVPLERARLVTSRLLALLDRAARTDPSR